MSETRPVSKACQRVMNVIDSKQFVRSSECEQRILAASRTVRWALLHRVRERGLNCESRYTDTGLCRTVSDLFVYVLNIRFKTGQMCYSGI